MTESITFGGDERPATLLAKFASRRGDTIWQAALKSAARSMATQLSRGLARGLLGAFKRGR